MSEEEITLSISSSVDQLIRAMRDVSEQAIRCTRETNKFSRQMRRLKYSVSVRRAFYWEKQHPYAASKGEF